MKVTPLKSFLLLAGLLTVSVPASLLAKSCCDAEAGCCDVSEDDVSREVMQLPRLLDLGANKCIPCKMMEPILEELTEEYAGQLEVEFIDIWKDREAGSTYGVKSIPTQIFFSAEGEELFRHTGFYPKADILAKWKELGVELTPVSDDQDKE